MDQCLSLHRVLQRGEGRSDQIHLLVIIRRNKLNKNFQQPVNQPVPGVQSGDGATESEPEKNIAELLPVRIPPFMFFLCSLSVLYKLISDQPRISAPPHPPPTQTQISHHAHPTLKKIE